ncbi:exopolyphosphatase [Idiomarina seosinensis]|uniref:Ppx/GppA phosphatase family protein n=1 Tax=Idiomarina seosinensis TaxID=281739 RepID=UPI00385023BF
MTDPKTAEPQHFAALDLGSNSFHLLIARVVEGQLQPVLKLKQPVQLGEGTSKSQRYLTDDAINRGIEALRQCAPRLEGFSKDQVTVVATHTLRKAKNRKRFLAEAAKVLPFPIEVISGREEARLIFRGVSETNAENGLQLVIDIGGGSTEFAVGVKRQSQFLSSRSIGSLACSEAYFKNGKITAKRFKKAIVYARQQTEPVANYLADKQLASVFGTSGTIKAIDQWISRRQGEASHAITLEQLQCCQDELVNAGSVSNLPDYGLSPERQRSLAGGLAVLIGVFEELNLTQLKPHDAALREGVLYELADEVLTHLDVRERTINSLARRYSVDADQAARVWSTTQLIWQGVADDWGVNDNDLYVLLEGAAMLHEVGLSISASGVQKHSGYILANAYMPGFNAEEQSFLATVVRFFRKKILMSEFPELALFSQNQQVKLTIMLRLAVIVNSDRQDRKLLKKAVADGTRLFLTLTEEAKSDPVLQAQLAQETHTLNRVGYQLNYDP